jgi:hypothetical protein
MEPHSSGKKTMNLKLATFPVASCLLVMTACGKVDSAPQSMPGAYAAASVTDPNVQAAARFAIDAEQQALLKAGESGTLDLVSILGAEQQVVAGVNYRLRLRVRRSGQAQDAAALVWWQAWRKPDPYQLTSWQWQ